MNWIERFQLFLGPRHFRYFVILLGGSGLLSLVLVAAFPEESWSAPAQTILGLACLVGAGWLIGSRMDRSQLVRWIAILSPVAGLLIVGLFFLPDLLPIMFGASAGWIIAGLFLFRSSQAPREYKIAIKQLRKGEYQEAVAAMDRLIKIEADKAGHYRFRAEILRLWGKLGRAKNDYKMMLELNPQDAVAYNGLAEVEVQAGHFDEALVAAQSAYDLLPKDWVTSYNLGMIYDRLQQSEKAVEALERSLTQKVPDSRHRLLIYLYLSRAYQLLGNEQAYQESLVKLKKEKEGMEEWQQIIHNDKAATLRAVIGDDIEEAQRIMIAGGSQ